MEGIKQTEKTSDLVIAKSVDCKSQEAYELVNTKEVDSSKSQEADELVNTKEVDSSNQEAADNSDEESKLEKSPGNFRKKCTSKYVAGVTQPGVNFINCFAPCDNLLHPAPNIYTSKKLLKSFFLMLVLLRRTSFFWTPSKSYISVNFTHYNYKFMPWCGCCKVFLSPALCSESHIGLCLTSFPICPQ